MNHHTTSLIRRPAAWLRCVVFAPAISAGLARTRVPDQLVWLRRSSTGETVALYLHGEHFVVVENDGTRTSTRRLSHGPGVDSTTPARLQPWMSTPWVVLFREDFGHACATGGWYLAVLQSAQLRRLDSDRFRCNPVSASMRERERVTTVTIQDQHAHVLVVTAD
jgi:hypothetical protein